MADIRENMTKEDVIYNMLELANHLAKQCNAHEIDVKVENLNMRFEAWMDEKQRKENR